MKILKRCYFCRKITNPFSPNRLIFEMYYGNEKATEVKFYMCKSCAIEWEKIAEKQKQELRERIAKEKENET